MMKQFVFGGRGVPKWVAKVRDSGEHMISTYVPPGGLVITPDGKGDTATTRIHSWWTYPRDGMGPVRVVLMVEGHGSGPESTEYARCLWYYGSASGCGYDKMTAAAIMPGPLLTCDGQSFKLSDHSPTPWAEGTTDFQFRDLERTPLPNGGRWRKHL